MAEPHPKSIDGLMRYLRDKKGISISGSSQKRKLMNMGYYHGYKGQVNLVILFPASTKIAELIFQRNWESDLLMTQML